MKITTVKNDETVTLELDGWLDTVSSPELGAAVDAIGACRAIVLDFDKVEYIASSGLREVVACHRKAKEIGASFSLVNVGHEAMSIFILTGLDKKLSITAK